MATGVQREHIYKSIATVAILFCATIILAPSARAFSGAGSGTPSDPYEIYTCTQLQEVANDLAASYELLDDIDCTGVSYTAIGTSGTPFTGSLDGNLQTISHITINVSSNAQGIFGATDGATLENIKLTNNSITGDGAVGMLIGEATDGIVRNIRAESSNSVSGSGNVGGLVGGSNASSLAISRSYFKGTVTLTGAYGGGLLGYGTGTITISDSFTAATINGGVSYAGGLVGSFNSGSPVVARSYTASTVNGSGLYFGGFIGGFFVGTVQNSFAATDMSDNPANSGGLFGVGDGTSTNNYLDEFAATISNCSDTGAASCTAVNAGNATPNYFVNNSTNAPLDTWNFDYLWENASGLPTFALFGAVQADTPTTTASSINFGYQFVALINAGPVSNIQLRYRPASGGVWTYLSGLASNNTDYTLSGLAPSTEYSIELRAYYAGVGEFSDWDDGRLTATTLAATTNSSETLAETGDNYGLLVIFALFMAVCSIVTTLYVTNKL